MKSGLVEADDKRLAEKIEKKFFVYEYQTEDRKTAWNRKPERVWGQRDKQRAWWNPVDDNCTLQPWCKKESDVMCPFDEVWNT